MLGFINGAEATPKKASLSKLAYAVAMAETNDCTRGYGTTHSNCFGIKKYRDGKLQMARYASKKAAYEDFISVWTRMYNGNPYPTIDDAIRYTGNDNAITWRKNVLYYLNS